MLVYATQRPAVDIFERFVEKTFKVIANQHLKIHWTTLVAMLLGSACIYACGLLWLSGWVGFSRVLGVGLYPFVVGDALKVALAAVFCHRAAKA